MAPRKWSCQRGLSGRPPWVSMGAAVVLISWVGLGVGVTHEARVNWEAGKW